MGSWISNPEEAGRIFDAMRDDMACEQIVISKSNIIKYLDKFETEIGNRLFWSVPLSLGWALLGMVLTVQGVTKEKIFGLNINIINIILSALLFLAIFCTAVFTIRPICYFVRRKAIDTKKMTTVSLADEIQEKYSMSRYYTGAERGNVPGGRAVLEGEVIDGGQF